MILPTHYVAIIDDVVNRIAKYGEKGRIPTSIILKGDIYSGVEQLHAEVFRKTETACSRYYNIKKLRLHLTVENLANEIQKELNAVEKSPKKGTIFFLEGIERLFNTPPGIASKKNPKMGRYANITDTIQEAHKLRKILLENTSKVAIISSSGPFTTFMEDPELPFYKFFNEITLTPLTPIESDKCFTGLLKKNLQVDAKNPTFSELANYAPDWIFKLTGGNWILLQKLVQIISLTKDAKNTIKNKSIVSDILEDYFTQLMPMLFLELEGLSREEKRVIENSFALATRFNTRDINSEINNPSLMAQRLVSKGFLSKDRTGAGNYIFKHTALRTMLRYYSKYELIDVFSDNSIQ